MATDYLQHLRAERRRCKDKHKRSDLSKQIQKEVRRNLRISKNKRISETLKSFRGLSDLHCFHHLPVTRRAGCSSAMPNNMADFMTNIFSSSNPHFEFDPQKVQAIEDINMEELNAALRKMSRGKCRDKAGVALEMILSGGVVVTFLSA